MRHRDAVIVGVYATQQAWRIEDRSPFELVREAVDRALANAGLSRGDIDGVAVDWPGPGGVRDEPSPIRRLPRHQAAGGW